MSADNFNLGNTRAPVSEEPESNKYMNVRPNGGSSGLPDPNNPVKKLKGKSNNKKLPSEKILTGSPRSGMSYSGDNNITQQKEPTNLPHKKSKKPLFIVIGVLLLVIILVVAYIATRSPKQAVTNYDFTGRYALDNLQNSVISYNKDNINKVSDNSFVSAEWSYANNSELRQKWINSICSYVKFSYPEVQALDTKGNLMVDKTGNRVMKLSDMLDNEDITITIVDYKKLSATMAEEKEAILKLYAASNYKPTDYDYTTKMTNLMLDYLLSKSNLPTTTTTIKIPVSLKSSIKTGNDGKPYSVSQYVVSDDSTLDKVLFSSIDFHSMCDTFAKIILGVDTTLVDNTFVPEKIIPYTWIGAYFCEKEYKGTSIKEAQVGDGTFKYPAGIGTSIITIVKATDGTYHDIRVKITGYWTGKDAIDYAISFSEKNRGFDNSSIVKLICYEVSIENLESSDITINSELYLSDATLNQSARTGTMYGFYSENILIPAGKSVVINDWATSTELDQKYVCWGKSFVRTHAPVWFKLLAGSGTEVEKYNATTSTVNRVSSEPTTTAK